MSISNIELATRLAELIDRWNVREDEMLAWLGGAYDGGPNDDGRYPITDGVDQTHNVLSPAALEYLVTGQAPPSGGGGGGGGGSVSGRLYLDIKTNAETPLYLRQVVLSSASAQPGEPIPGILRTVYVTTSGELMDALGAVQPGDRILVADGTYSVGGTNNRTLPAMNPWRSGTSANPIHVQAENIFGATLRLAAGAGPIIGCFQRHNVVWDGFYIDEANAPPVPDTGPVVLWGSNNCEIRNCRIQCRSVAGIYPLFDNHNAIRVGETNNCRIYNNELLDVHGAYTANRDWHQNNAGLMVYRTVGLVVEHNYVRNSGSGIYLKALCSNCTIRYNRITGCEKGIKTSYANVEDGTYARLNDGSRILIYQNLVLNGTPVDGRQTINGLGINLAENSYDVIAVNNTVYQMGTAWASASNQAGNVVRNNIFVGTQFLEGNVVGVDVTAAYDADRNIYFDGTLQFWNEGVSSALSWTQWRALGVDTNSITSAPQFTDASGGVFTIQSSAALSLGRDYLNLSGNGENSTIPVGCYLTGNETIGRVN